MKANKIVMWEVTNFNSFSLHYPCSSVNTCHYNIEIREEKFNTYQSTLFVDGKFVAKGFIKTLYKKAEKYV